MPRDKDLYGRGQLEIGIQRSYSGLLVFYCHSRMSAGSKSKIITLRESFEFFIQRHKFMNGSEKNPSSKTPMVFIFKSGI